MTSTFTQRLSFIFKHLHIFTERSPITLAAWVTLPLLFTMLFSDELSTIYERLPTLVAAHALIATTVMTINWNSIRSSVHPSAILQSHLTGTLASGWALVGVAVTLRLILVEYLLPGYPFAFEETTDGQGDPSRNAGKRSSSSLPLLGTYRLRWICARRRHT